METHYTPNSHKYKQEQKEKAEKPQMKKVVKGSVKTKKKSKVNKFTELFLPSDVTSIKDYVIHDVLIPAGKKLVSDTVDTVLYGEPGRRKDTKRSSGSFVSYRSYSDRDKRDRDDRRSSYRDRRGYDYDDIILETRGEAEDVLTCLEEALDRYDVVSVADLYDLVGMSRVSVHTDNKYGWTSLRNADIIRTRDGYQLKLPRVEPIR